MIRRLRRRHFVLAVLLAVLIPAILLLGLRARRPAPVQTIPAALVKP